MSIEGVVDQFAAPKIWMSLTDILERSSPVPRTPGIYARYLSTNAVWADSAPRIVHSGCALMYIGIAPARRNSTSNLRKRLRQHCSGNLKSSTLRRSMAALLLPGTIEAPSAMNSTQIAMLNDQVNEILDRHARVSWFELQDPWALEPRVISALQPPLNLDHNAQSQFGSRLKNQRALISRR
jgi:hypothetical protein